MPFSRNHSIKSFYASKKAMNEKGHSKKKNGMKPVVLIQCRSSSSRLPGKALLPIRGIVSAVLCAKRAANSGLDVKIVTSKDPSDDELAKTLKAERVAYFRGNLRNVLQRFYDALYGVDGCTAVVRLTADHLFVDGTLSAVSERLVEEAT
jgi:spore coat polysaccharide biosynthesis protein SpsF (cytidylyltransferase family)